MTPNPGAGPAEDFTYTYRPSALGASRVFRLESDAIIWDSGRHSGRVAFSDIRRVRMSYRPAGTQNHRFVTEIWSPGAPKLMIASTSTRNVVEQERLDTPYVRFVTELHHRIGNVTTGETIFQSGIAPLIYWLGIALYIAAGISLAGLFVRSLQAGIWSAAAIIGVFFAVFLWNANYFRRNYPGRYRPDALLPDLLPRPR